MTDTPDAIDDPAAPAVSDGVAEGDHARHPRAVRRSVVVAGGLVTLVVGVLLGMLIGPVRTGQPGAPESGSVDVGFAQDMRVHLLKEVTMATMARDRSTDPAVRTLAFSIEGASLSQIGMMSGWLALWGQPDFPDPDARRPWPTGAAHTGTATSDELAQLRILSGGELDVLFLQLMLRHHQGALPMARYAAQHAGQGAVRNLADKILTSQTTEDDTLTSMLSDRGAQPLPAPS